MNNFKKFVTVLLGVLMACVFATSAFAADFSNADTAAKLRPRSSFRCQLRYHHD